MSRLAVQAMLSALLLAATTPGLAETGLPSAATGALKTDLQPQSEPAKAGSTAAPSPEADATSATPEATPAEPAPDTKAEAAPASVIEPTTPVAVAVKSRLNAIPDEGTDEEKKERAALIAFYGARAYAPLWVDAKGFTADGTAVLGVFPAAGEWGLDAADFVLPKLDAPKDGELTADAQAAAETDLSLAVMKYARYARGGRIMDPAGQLNSNLDRKPQLIAPDKVLEELGAATDKAAYLVGTHPQQPQFQRLKEKYVEALAKNGGKPNAATKKIQANMEMWRWMWADLGDLHLMANVPSYMIEVVKNGETIHTERIVVGEIGKQSSIFTRRLQDITFRPMWRVPESIKVNELWPSLLRGGGLMRQYGLEVETKDGRRLDWRTMDWRTLDIRNYEVVQPPQRNSAMGVVKFSFPSQHTIFMHDTPDKWMFNSKQRTLSHGCLRLRNPLRVAELVLENDKGWDAAKVAELAKSGPLNNQVLIEKRIPMHIAYFTAWVDDTGALKAYSDIYGHEKRVTQALDGKWQQIAKGRDHLAPVEPDRAHLEPRSVKQASSRSKSANDDFLGSFFGGGL
ncbi:L,D-transpeptidase family protein [Hyphomicrobium sp.]|uniref:L,D-transpeptidase family protein n=1 Tax=Hyphomicrobium sp. TaxID=82 RepID=UPI002E36F834|nr:L,D-transpeptidase family protein [Hyphomicrobium sp.]HEX2842929.1 L,D-transpeptidase family protein [Hyphomicrobium sp.]